MMAMTQFPALDLTNASSIQLQGFWLIISALQGMVQPWVFWTLLYQGRKDTCELSAFILAFFDFYNPHDVRFIKAVSILAVLSSVLCLLIGLFAMFRPKTTSEAYRRLLKDMSIDPERPKSSGHSLWSFVPQSFPTILSIVVIEKLIKGNHIDLSHGPLRNTGQLIPSLVALFTLISVLWSSLVGRGSRKESAPDLELSNKNIT